jgi:hypothetical protein
VFETWSLTLIEENKLKILENMVLRRIFGLQGDELIGDWRQLHTEEHLNLYFSPNVTKIKSRSITLAGNMARMGKEFENT